MKTEGFAFNKHLCHCDIAFISARATNDSLITTRMLQIFMKTNSIPSSLNAIILRFFLSVEWNQIIYQFNCKLLIEKYEKNGIHWKHVHCKSFAIASICQMNAKVSLLSHYLSLFV